MNLEKVIFGFFILLAATLNFGFFIGDLTDPSLHSVYAVSYTHLRAHETVLDLVCRLLLAKKQTNN